MMSGFEKLQRRLAAFFLLNCFVLIGCIYRFGGEFSDGAKTKLAIHFYNGILEVYSPAISYYGSTTAHIWYKDMVAAVLPNLSYYEQLMWYEAQVEDFADYENLTALGKQQMELLLAEQAQDDSKERLLALAIAENDQVADTVYTQPDVVETDAQAGAPPDAAGSDASVSAAIENVPTDSSNLQDSSSGIVDDTYPAQAKWPSATGKAVEVNRDKLQDFDYLKQNFFIVDSSTTIGSDQLNANSLLGKNMAIDDSIDGPQILIYHTHSQEGYVDSTEGDAATSVVAVGEYLAQILTEQYGYRVLHHTGAYDVGDRDHAYSNAAPALAQILADNPSIQVVIDLHRDSVREDTHLVTEINGKQTAKIMFFNGLCRTTKQGELTAMPNPYLADNLALSFQMQLAATEYYPDFTRRIYLKGYRYNMHYCPKSMLIEVGAQNNTLEEAMNAMEPLADLLSKVLQ